MEVDEDIKGIYINKVGQKLSQVANDTQLVTNGDRKSFEKSIHVVNTFGTVSVYECGQNLTQAVKSIQKQNTCHI